MEALEGGSGAPEAVKELLTSHRMTIRQLSEASGIAYATLLRRLSGESPFNVIEIAIVGNVLGVSGSSILARAEKAQETNG
jgi:transcriptional regulator with XRE-family HTH domain